MKLTTVAILPLLSSVVLASTATQHHHPTSVNLHSPKPTNDYHLKWTEKYLHEEHKRCDQIDDLRKCCPDPTTGLAVDCPNGVVSGMVPVGVLAVAAILGGTVFLV
jgi:hypothetical protein